MTQEELKEYLVEEAEYSEEEVEGMNSFDLLDAYLQWNGLCGYTDDVISAVQGAFDLAPGTIKNPYDDEEWA